MLIEDTRICESLRRIVSWSTADPVLREDLMQECLIRLWRLERDEPGRTRSWYLQNCRFHLQHYLAAGRSVDSPKRTNGDTRIPIDGDSEELPADWYHTNGDLLEGVIFRDIVSTLSCRLRPCESAVLGGLAEGLVLQEIAARLDLSYPTALKYRRQIADLTVKLGISPPRTRGKGNARVISRANGVGSRHTPGEDLTPNDAPLPDAFPASSPEPNGRARLEQLEAERR